MYLIDGRAKKLTAAGWPAALLTLARVQDLSWYTKF